MKFIPTSLKGSFVIELSIFPDERGWFARYFCKDEFRSIGHDAEWVQMNHSANFLKGTLRGLHYQPPPFSEIKLVRCVNGAIWDVIVDIRNDSPTFLKWFAVELSDANKNMIYIPAGFAHGFQCLTDDCQLLYHHTDYYNPEAQKGIRFDDPLLNISWPLPVSVLSKRDSTHDYLPKNFKGI
jgi:dTDP-4-dehydrorhamnose 3,5-epimerase